MQNIDTIKIKTNEVETINTNDNCHYIWLVWVQGRSLKEKEKRKMLLCMNYSSQIAKSFYLISYK